MTRTIKAELVLDAHARHGEGPLWHPTEHTLDWVDIMAGLVHRFDPLTGTDVSVDVGQPVGAVVPRAAGGYALAVRDGWLGRLDVERANGGSVWQSPLGAALEAAGFRATPKGLRLRG
jgi:sugar lactone lactonase YvrE